MWKLRLDFAGLDVDFVSTIAFFHVDRVVGSVTVFQIGDGAVGVDASDIARGLHSRIERVLAGENLAASTTTTAGQAPTRPAGDESAAAGSTATAVATVAPTAAGSPAVREFACTQVIGFSQTAQ